MKVKEMMTHPVITVSPHISLSECAKRMRDFEIGVMPVCDGDVVKGLITDRDLVVRGLADIPLCGDAPVGEIMSSPVEVCFEDDEVETAVRVMEVKQIRRLVIFNRKKQLVGIVSLTDLAVSSEKWSLSEEALKKMREFPE
jgi:CBS domain-containing protein